MTTIDHEQDLHDFCHPLLSLEEKNFISLDTEFVRETTYWPDLCLIQLATQESSVIIDPLAIKDLSSLSKLLTAPHITKIFHSGRQDLEIFWHLFKVLPSPIFD